MTVKTYNGFTLDKLDCITDPGKFEGQPWWVPEWWGKVLQGEADEEKEGEPIIYSFKLDEEDWANNSFLYPHERLLLWQTDSGFVYYALMDMRA